MPATLPLRLRARRWIAHRFGQDVLLRHTPLHLALGYSTRGSIVRDRIGGLVIEYDTRSVIGSALFTRGTFERREIAFLQGLVRRASKPIVLDIGANIGLHALACAEARPDATVYAFEPSPATAELLAANVRNNKLGARIHIIREAVSDSIGTATLHECDDNAFSSLKDTHRKHVVGTTQVPTTTLDEIVKTRRLDRVDVMKIDVEGFEGHVIRGGEATLRRLKPDLFIEIYGGDASNPDPAGTVEQIRALGYRAFVLVGGEPVPYTTHSDERYNYYFTMK